MFQQRLNQLGYQFKNSLRNREAHVVLLVILCALYLLGFIIEAFSGLFLVSKFEINEFYRNYLYFPSDFERAIRRPWTIVTSIFLHSGFRHLFSNAIILYFFGQMLENLLGKKQVWQVFIYGGIAGCVAYLLAVQTFPIFQEFRYSSTLVGASGGAFALMVALVTLSPNYTINLFGIVPVKVKWIALFFIVTELLNISDSNAGGHFAHIGGMALGFAYIKLLKGRVEFPNFKWPKRKKKPKFKVTINKDYKKEPNNTKVNQDEIDAILNKIARSGYDSLSKSEKEALFKSNNHN